MESRLFFSAVFMILMLVLLLCAINAGRHYKALGMAVARLDIALIPPILGNCIILASKTSTMSLIGYYIYFVGMNYTLFELMRFTRIYCNQSGYGKKLPTWLKYFLLADAIQILLNIVTHHAFTVEKTVLDGMDYYPLVPLAGQVIHRIIVIVAYSLAILIFFMATTHASKIYRERYSIILVFLAVIGVWEAYHLIVRDPIDHSMIGLGAFGIIIYYFSIHYRPLRLLDRILSGVISNGSDAIFIFTPRGRCIWTNKEGCYLVGVQEDNCDNAPELLEYLFGTKLRRGNWSEKHMTGGGDSIKYYLLENREVGDAENMFSGYYLRVRDITEEQLRLKREMYEATHDTLTGLYTKDHLYKLILAEVRSHRSTVFMILIVNIRNFRVLNDIFGADFVDHVLTELAEYLTVHLSRRCSIGRIGGGDFGILIPKDEFHPDKVEKILSDFTIKGDTADYPIQIQVGAYEITRDEPDVVTMFSRARLALSTITDEYAKKIAYYDDKIRQEILWNQEITAELSEAIEHRDIRPYLQPIVDRNGKIVGAEALVRWIHPQHGFLAPFKFIPTLERNGLIAEVDKYMWRCACEILHDWKKRGLDLFLSVNISPKDFYFMDVPKYIKDLVKEYEIEPGRLRVEITETVMMNDSDKMLGILKELRDGGFIVEMDDFGSGYSSLNMLKDMPVDVLKIDMKFLGKSDNEQRADTIVKNIINLSKELGITSLTEGVETLLQYNGLSDMGCKLFQGYYFSKPIPVEDFEHLVDQDKQAM